MVRLTFTFLLLTQISFAINPEFFKKAEKSSEQWGDLPQCKLIDKKENTYGLECYIAADAEWALLKEITSDLKEIPNWLPKSVNKEEFFIQLLKMDFLPPEQFKLTYRTQLLFFKTLSERLFKVKLTPSKDTMVLRVEAHPEPDSMMSKASADLYFFESHKGDERIYVFFDGLITFRDTTLYLLLPQKLIENQVKERIALMIKNYRKEETRRRALKKTR